MRLIIIFLIALFMVGLSYADEIDDLIPHIIQVESGGNPNAISKDGCIGLMQISRTALAEYNYHVYKGPLWGDTCSPHSHVYGCVHVDWTGIETITHDDQDLFIPDINIKIGEWYLRRLKDHYLKNNYTIERMLCAWNGGITRLRQVNYDCSKMPKESRNFSRKVIILYEKSM